MELITIGIFTLILAIGGGKVFAESEMRIAKEMCDIVGYGGGIAGVIGLGIGVVDGTANSNIDR